LSWLVFDSGPRSANGENARQLLAAAAATQDSDGAVAVPCGVAGLLHGAGDTQAAVVSTTEAERAAREEFQRAAESRYNVGVATPADRLQAQTALSQATLNRIRPKARRAMRWERWPMPWVSRPQQATGAGEIAAGDPGCRLSSASRWR
jgi:hypothetical protein